MLTLPSSVKIYLASEPADMRRGFDGLAALVRDILEQNPLCGHLFVFRNKRKNRVKILYWDRQGFCLFYKRLEKGVFKFPAGQGAKIEVDAGDLNMILEGIDLANARRRPRIDADNISV